MDDFKAEARKQYLGYFKGWFILVAVVLAITIVLGIRYKNRPVEVRANTTAPTERVYDYADVLTDAEENLLRSYIAEKEALYKADFVIVTFMQEVEGEEAQQKYAYDSTDWETNMQNLADDFWDEKGYGYNKNFEGDGSILIDNRFPGQRGEWLSTSGNVEWELSAYEIDDILYAVDEYYDSSPYRAYKAYIDAVCKNLKPTQIRVGKLYYLIAWIVSAVVALAYASSHLAGNQAKNTVAVNAYVVGGEPHIHNQEDQYIRKSVISRHIETSSGSRSGGGGGGHHSSHSGASHGGGGHRH